jgi:hypothetical protein
MSVEATARHNIERCWVESTEDNALDNVALHIFCISMLEELTGGGDLVAAHIGLDCGQPYPAFVVVDERLQWDAAHDNSHLHAALPLHTAEVFAVVSWDMFGTVVVLSDGFLARADIEEQDTELLDI